MSKKSDHNPNSFPGKTCSTKPGCFMTVNRKWQIYSATNSPDLIGVEWDSELLKTLEDIKNCCQRSVSKREVMMLMKNHVGSSFEDGIFFHLYEGELGQLE